MTPPRSLILCTTPRSGSTLVCALIAAAGSGGAPESWYRPEDRADYATDWGIADAHGGFSAADYLAAAIRAGSGGDGTFGLRLQPGSLELLRADLASLSGPAPDLALMRRHLGPCRFLHVSRRDGVAQAISRLKAEVSQVWHLDGSEPAGPRPRAAYDAARIDAFRAEAARGNAAWEAWFAAEGIVPHRLVYEDFAGDPAAAVVAALDALGLPPQRAGLAVPNRRMADAESAAWATRYRAERGLPDAL